MSLFHSPWPTQSCVMNSLWTEQSSWLLSRWWHTLPSVLVCECRLEEVKLAERKIADDRHSLEVQLQHEVDKIKVVVMCTIHSSKMPRVPPPHPVGRTALGSTLLSPIILPDVCCQHLVVTTLMPSLLFLCWWRSPVAGCRTTTTSQLSHRLNE